MKVHILAAWLAIASCGAGGGCAKSGSAAKVEAADVTVARVDGRPILKSDVTREAVAQGLLGEGESLDVSSDLFQRVLDEVIDQKLLAAEAVRRGLDRQPAAERRVAQARERILGDMVVEGAVAKAVNEKAVEALYQEQLKIAHPGEEFRARQIIVATQAEADSIREQLNGGAAFPALAASRSADPQTRANGGDLGYVTPDVMPPAYGAALKHARRGQLIGPFKSDSGWVLLKVEDRRAQTPPTLEASRAQIVRFLTYAQVGDLLKSLRDKQRVELLTPSAPRTRPGTAQGADKLKGQL